jgi:hypothetical protein
MLFFDRMTHVFFNRMKLSDAQMDLLVSACQDRLSRLDDAVLQEFEKAMELTFMPYIRTRLEIFDQEGGFSALPGTEIPDTNESGEDALSPRSDSETLPLRDSGPLRASASADTGDTGSFDWPDGPDGGGFSALPRMRIPGANDSELREDAPSPHTIPLQGATRARIPTTTSEMCVERGRKGSRQANIPGGLLGTCLERPACQRGVKDVAFDDVTPTSDGLPENWDELFERYINVDGDQDS